MRFVQQIILAVLTLCLMACTSPFVGSPILTEETAELETLLAEMPWVSPDVSDERVIYQFSFRTCPPCLSFKQEAWPKLHQAGIDTRVVMTARRKKSTADERTAVVELARSRDWEMAEAWLKRNSPKGYYKEMRFPAVDGNAPREADLETLRQQIDMLREILGVNGVDMAYPVVLWQDADKAWRVEIGYSMAMANAIISSMGKT